MRKIVIVGISGTGKSVFGRKLAETTGLPLLHMDSLIWRPDWTESPGEAVEAALSQIISTPGWIVEGWVDLYSKPRLQASDTVLYLDYPGWLAAFGGLQRWWRHRGGRRMEMPAGCLERFDLDFIKTMLLSKEQPHIEAILGTLPHLNVTRLRSRRGMKALLKNPPMKIG